MGILNERIKEVRISRGLTLKDVAAALGVEEATAQRYESGSIKNIKHETVCQLSDLFRCDPSYLMGWSQTPYRCDERASSYSVTVQEMEIIQKYRQLDPRGQQAVLDTIERELTYVGEGLITIRVAASSGSNQPVVVRERDATAALEAIDATAAEADKENEGL